MKDISFGISISLFIPALIGLGLLVVFLSKFIYRKHIEKSIKEEKSQAHMVLPDPSDMTRVVIVAIVITLLVLLMINNITLSRSIDQLKTQLTEYQVQSNNDHRYIISTINDLQTSMVENIKKANSNISIFQYQYGTFDTANKKIEVIYQLKFKDIDANVKVYGNFPLVGKVSFTRNENGFYEAKAFYDIFSDYNIDDSASITVINGSMETTEDIELSQLPSVIFTELFLHTGNISYGENIALNQSDPSQYRLNLDSIDFFYEEEDMKKWDNIQKVTLSIYEDDKEQRCDDISSYYGSFQKQISLSPEAYAIKNKDFDLLEVVLKVYTKDGFVISNTIHRLYGHVDDNSGMAAVIDAPTITIYGPDGKVCIEY